MAEEPRTQNYRSSVGRQIRRAMARAAESTPSLAPAPYTRVSGPRLEPVSASEAMKEWQKGFTVKNRVPFEFQKKAWLSFNEGNSGIIIAPTGNGKTLAALGRPLIQLRAEGSIPNERPDSIRILYISPLKALIQDISLTLQQTLLELNWNFYVETRTGDTIESTRKLQRERLPEVLLTTPESLALLITQEGWKKKWSGLTAIILDEWHELMGSKRGSLLELTLSRIRSVAPRAQTWGVSATLADPLFAAQVAMGSSSARSPDLIQSSHDQDTRRREVEIQTLAPKEIQAIPWFGHGGLNRVGEVIAELDPTRTTLIFTNTRSQAERWYMAIRDQKPEWETRMGLHHGSLDPEQRSEVEQGLKSGRIFLVVATSSLDLGVDFPTVEKVIQIGSVKSVARAMQRAGRAFHRPGESTKLTVCPTHFLEYIEIAALRRGYEAGEIEVRVPPEAPLDVLVQFFLNAALGEGFRFEELCSQVRSAYSYRTISNETLAWVLDFVTTGGKTLGTYRKVEESGDGVYRFSTPKLARYHRMNIGTILGDSTVLVRYMQGKKLGQIDEEFVTQLKPGQKFTFAGKKLELFKLRDLTAYVKAATGKETVTTLWGGSSLPLSEGLSFHIRKILSELVDDKNDVLTPELKAIHASLTIQQTLSRVPRLGETLVERLETREGYHLFVYTWEGKLVNEGIGHLLAYRLSQHHPSSFAVSANDHGFECLSSAPLPDDEIIKDCLRESQDLERDIERSLNYPEMAKRTFREIARIACLIQTTLPQGNKSMRHLQMSSSLLFDVLKTYEPEHPLLQEAFRELKRRQLELPRLRRVVEEIASGKILLVAPKKLTPFAFPLYVQRVSSHVTSETLEMRIERMQKKYANSSQR